MAEYELQEDDQEYDVQFLDASVDADGATGEAVPVPAVFSYLLFDRRRQLTSWNLHAEDNCSDLERLFYPGLALEDFIEKAVKLGIIDTEGDELRHFVTRRLERFAAGNHTFQVRFAGDRWFRITDHRQPDGTTITTLVNISDVERRERALALLLGERGSGQPLFERAARALAMGLGFRTATVARLKSPEIAEIIAGVHNGQAAPPHRFAVRGTPCEPVYRAGYFAFTGDFLRRFPLIDLDDYFTEIGHGSYVGQVIYGKSGQPAGHILALDEAERVLDEGDKRLIRQVAEHVAFEFEREEVGVALKSGEQRFRDFAETASDLFFETDAALKCTYVSDRVEAVTGISAADWLSRSVSQLGPPHDLAWEACLQDIAEHRPFRDVFLKLNSSMGSVRNFSLSGKPIFDDGQQFRGYRMAAREIAPNLQAEGRAREAELRVRQLLSTSLEGFALYDDDYRLVLCNDKFKALMFRGSEDRINAGMTLKQLSSLWLRQSNDAERRALLQFHLDPDALAGDNLDIAGLDGKTLRVIRRRTEDGGVATLYLDITDLKHREEELSEAKEIAEQANSTKSRFLANISHELRTPLNAIIGFSEIMHEQILGPMTNPRYHEYTNDINNSAKMLLDLINDILDLSKAEAGQLELHPEKIDVGELVNSVVHLMRDQAQAAHLHLVAFIHVGIPPVRGDARRIKQVLLNLISNAIKFTPSGGTVEVTARCEDNLLKIIVNDTGIGIAPDQIGKVFMPFQQVASEISRRHTGTGLGLPLARHLVELHGGELTLDSEPGRGTTVEAHFPVDDENGDDDDVEAA